MQTHDNPATRNRAGHQPLKIGDFFAAQVAADDYRNPSVTHNAKGTRHFVLPTEIHETVCP
ncbi:hypothetical protein ACFY0R_10280 [Streptomyces sp. NPDC001633]|uniref:hypothetical protein n=1 Tax=Streptomyces sp. NPDC001633 TaxID=3364595 RepID=UPI0036B6595A